MRCKFAGCALVLAVLAAPAFTQSQSPDITAQAPDAVSQPQPRHRASHGASWTPCWKQAGIPPQNVNRRWKIEDEGKVKIAGVCNNASLSPEQKRVRIEEINQETKHEVADLISAKQLQDFNSCQAEVDKKRPATADQKELGPCGGVMPQSSFVAPVRSHESKAKGFSN